MHADRDPWGAVSRSVAALGVPVDPGLEGRAREFLTELARWERVGRLTGYRRTEARVRHLVVESLLLLAVLPDPVSPLLDIGTGAGVPGLILKCARPDWEIALLEANRRRANFLRHAVRALGVDSVAVHQGRAEILGAAPPLRAGFQTVTMRAVAAPARGVGLAAPFLRSDGHLVLPLGSERYTGPGRVQEVHVEDGGTGLFWRRTFLIISAGEVSANVPRGTLRARGTHCSRRQSEGRGGKDDDSG